MSDEPRKVGSGDRSFERRLAAYAAGAGAVLVAGDAADAGIVWSGPQNTTVVTGTGVGTSFNLDMNGDAVSDYGFTGPATYGSFPDKTAGQIDLQAGPGNRFNTGGSPLNAGLNVSGQALGATGGFQTLTRVDSASNPPGSGPFYNVANKFLALQFDAGAGNLRYGWVQLSDSGGTDPNQHPVLTIHDWAYEDTGASLYTGQVPEPSGLALLALGAAGIAAYRPSRRRRRDEPS